MYLHLTRLKARILPAETTSQTRFDTRLEAVAKGVAAAFDRYTSRTLLRGTSQVERFAGGSSFYSLSRYPLESVASAILTDPEGGTETLDIVRISKAAGLVHFDGAQGTERDEIAITLTGGYYVDTSADGSGSLPAGATAMPDDLLDAWVLQIDHEARVRKVFGGTADSDLAAMLPTDFDLIPRVDRVLKHYARIIG